MRRASLVFVLPALLSWVACGEAAPEHTASPRRGPGLYVPIAPHSRALSTPTFAAGDPLPIYLNRWGGTYYGGTDDSATNTSSVVGSGSATLDAFDGSDAMWADVVSCVQDQFSRFGAVVTDNEPASGDYVEAVIAGTPQDVGLPNGVGGVAPIDTWSCNIIPDAVVYVFALSLPLDAQTLCEVAAQEIAHALSLDHELLCEDPMTYLNGCGAKTFQDAPAQCGEYSPRACSCNRPSQNSVEILYEKLGASDGTPPPPPASSDDVPPQVSLVSPADGEELPANGTVNIVATASDDVGLAAVELEWDFSGDVFACPITGSGFSCAVSGNTFTWSLDVGTGSRTFRVRARDLGGNVRATSSRTVTLGGGGTPTTDAEPPEVAIASPVEDAVLSDNGIIEIVATATDDVAVAEAVLEWDFTGESFPCAGNDGLVACERVGSTYRWQVPVSTGRRDYRVRANDTAGRTAVTGTRTLWLESGAILPPDDDAYEDNDTWDTATPIPCSTGLDLHAATGEVDWLAVGVSPGIEVTATLTSLDGAILEMALAEGPRTADVRSVTSTGSSKSDAVTATRSRVGVRVRATGSDGAYRVVVTCGEPGGGGNDRPGRGDDAFDDDDDLAPPPAAGAGCASTPSTSFAGALVLLALLALARRRRPTG